MINKNIYRVSIILLVLVACSLFGFLVARQSAIHNAIEACNPGYGLQPVGTPTSAEAHLTTFGKAEGGNPWDPTLSGRPVWVVVMHGSWIIVGGPPPALSNPAQGPFYEDTRVQIIDAVTGESRSVAIQ